MIDVAMLLPLLTAALRAPVTSPSGAFCDSADDGKLSPCESTISHTRTWWTACLIRPLVIGYPANSSSAASVLDALSGSSGLALQLEDLKAAAGALSRPCVRWHLFATSLIVSRASAKLIIAHTLAAVSSRIYQTTVAHVTFGD